jgi:hypothetical protein
VHWFAWAPQQNTTAQASATDICFLIFWKSNSPGMISEASLLDL